MAGLVKFISFLKVNFAIKSVSCIYDAQLLSEWVNVNVISMSLFIVTNFKLYIYVWLGIIHKLLKVKFAIKFIQCLYSWHSTVHENTIEISNNYSFNLYHDTFMFDLA